MDNADEEKREEEDHDRRDDMWSRTLLFPLHLEHGNYEHTSAVDEDNAAGSWICAHSRSVSGLVHLQSTN